MAFKTVLTNLITGNWGDITSPKRLPVKDREVGSAIVDELYPAILADTEDTVVVITKAGNNWDYIFKFQKQGGNILVRAEVRKSEPGDLTNDVLATITNPEYLPAEMSRMFGFDTTDERMQLKFETDTVSLVGTLTSGNVFIFNANYPAAN